MLLTKERFGREWFYTKYSISLNEIVHSRLRSRINHAENLPKHQRTARHFILTCSKISGRDDQRHTLSVTENMCGR